MARRSCRDGGAVRPVRAPPARRPAPRAPAATTPPSTSDDADDVERRRALVEGEPADGHSGHRQQREQHGESTHGDPAQHVLVDAVADGVREHADERGRRRAVAATSTPRRSRGHRTGSVTMAPIARPTPSPATPAAGLGDPRPDTMYAAQHRRGGEQPRHARPRCRRSRHRRARRRRRRRARGRRRCGGCASSTAATTIGPMNSIVTPCRGRCGRSPCRRTCSSPPWRCRRSPPRRAGRRGPAAPEARRTTASTATAAPMHADPGDGLRRDAVEQQHGDRRRRRTGRRPRGRTGASGEAVSRNRATGTASRAPSDAGTDGTCPGGHVRHSKRSGSVRQISSHSGWKLNQPAKWRAGLPRPCTRRTRRGSASACRRPSPSAGPGTSAPSTRTRTRPRRPSRRR